VPATITPTTFADGVLGSGSLRDAVLQFNADTGTDDDIIQLQAGTYTLTIQNVGGHHETAGLTGDLNLTRASHRWLIQGAGPSTIIDAGLLHDRVFQIVNAGAQVVFRDLVIQGGLAQDDGSNGALAGSTDALGGGILNNGGMVTLDHVVVQNNVARGGDVATRTAPGHSARGGGIYSTGGALTMAGATITNNQVMGGRGGDQSVARGGAGGSAGGGGLYATGGSLDISDSTITNNQATGGRGGDGFFVSSSASYPTGGAGGDGQGGGLYVSGASLTVASSTIASNQVNGGPSGRYGGGGTGYGLGGGLYNGGTLTVTGSTLSANSSSASGLGGGGIANGGTLTVSNSTLSGNSAGFGGGILNYPNSTLTVGNGTLSNNSATSGGGGIYNIAGTVTVSKSTLAGNGGGGISNMAGTVTVSDSTVADNAFGSIFNWASVADHATFMLLNSTIVNNAAGAGVPLDAYYEGGGTGESTIRLGNTIVVGNGRYPNLLQSRYGSFVSLGHNLSSDDGSGFLTGPGDLTNTDPLLGPLQDNGGPTQTMALLPGSPALNVGNAAQLGVADQRGVVRTGGVNIGAYQASASAFVVTAPGTVASGTPFDGTVQAVDVFGQVAFGYRGTVTFSVTDPDPAVVLPADYTFTADDQGTHTFTGGFTLVTPGDQTLTVADLANGLSQDGTLTVTP
jgi:hypothetical protein